jgi:ribosomal protein L14
MESANPLDAINALKKRERKLEMFDVDVYVGKKIVTSVRQAAPTPEQAKVDVLRTITFKTHKTDGTK